MNILFVTYQGALAGSTFSVAFLADALASRGHNVFLATRENTLYASLLQHDRVKIITCGFKNVWDIATVSTLVRLVRQESIDILNAQSSIDRYLSIWVRFLSFSPVKVLHTRRQIPRSGGGILQAAFYTLGTHKIIAVSNGVKNALRRLHIPAGHIEVVYNGTPEDKYKHLDKRHSVALRERYGIGPDDFVIGCVSRKKQQEQILDALRFINASVHVFFIGVDRREEYDAIISRHLQHHTIHFLPKIAPHETLHYYPFFSVSVLASVTEGLSQTLLESMMLKVPVIATAAAGNLDLITHNHTGLLFKDHDTQALAHHIRYCMDNPDAAARLASNAYTHVRTRFTLEKTADAYERLFSGLLDASPGKRDAADTGNT